MYRPVRNWHLKAILISAGKSSKESLSLGDVSHFHLHQPCIINEWEIRDYVGQVHVSLCSSEIPDLPL